MSLTMQMPFSAETASTRAQRMTLHASSMHVLKPKDLKAAWLGQGRVCVV